jgi:hypothetical protein
VAEAAASSTAAASAANPLFRLAMMLILMRRVIETDDPRSGKRNGTKKESQPDRLAQGHGSASVRITEMKVG